MRDDDRHRDIRILLFYPLSEQSFPVIIFSPAAAAEPSDYVYLLKYWAEHGFVTIAVTHIDAERREAAERVGEDEFAYQAQMHLMLHDPAMWRSRRDDVLKVLDAVPSLKFLLRDPHPAFTGVPLALAGHSLGAQTVLLAAQRSTHVQAVLLLSPDGPGTLGLTNASWSRIRAPFMAMAGSNDEGPEGEPPSWRLYAAEHAAGSVRYAVTIDKAIHETFSGQFDGFPNPNPEEIIRTVSLAFLDATLKHDPAAQAYLGDHAQTQQCEGDGFELARFSQSGAAASTTRPHE